MKHIAILLTATLILASPAQASFCKNVAGQKVCILRIKHSAKNYWEYRVQLAVDGIAQPQAVYDCHERLWLQSGGQWTKFSASSASDVACSIFRD